jgi:hypothetical protein
VLLRADNHYPTGLAAIAQRGRHLQACLPCADDPHPVLMTGCQGGYGLPVRLAQLSVRVIWQESRLNAVGGQAALSSISASVGSSRSLALPILSIQASSTYTWHVGARHESATFRLDAAMALFHAVDITLEPSGPVTVHRRPARSTKVTRTIGICASHEIKLKTRAEGFVDHLASIANRSRRPWS